MPAVTGRSLSLVLGSALTFAALSAAVLADWFLYPASSWVLALYTLPLLASLILPVYGVALAAAATIICALLQATLIEALVWSPARIVSLLEILAISGMVLYVRSTRDHLERSKLRVSGILDGSDTGFVRTSADLTIVDANDPWLRVVGARRAGDVLGSRLTDWFPDAQRRSAEAMLAFLDEGDRRSFETVLRQRSGGGVNVVVTAYAERVGDRVQLAAVFADVTGIRRAEAQARASAQQLRSHLENTPLAAVVLDADQRVREWNHSAEQIFGYPRQTALGMDAWALVPSEQRGQRASPFGDGDGDGVGQGDAGRRTEQLASDGRRVTVQWYHTPLRMPDSNDVQIASLGLDVTRQERIEQALRVSEVKFSSIFQQSPDALVLMRRSDYQLLDANQSVERMFGWSREELHGRWDEILKLSLRGEDLDAFDRSLGERDGIDAFETELRTRDGRVMAVLMSARRLQIDGEETLLVAVRDLTAIREGEAERARLQQQLQHSQRLEGIGRLAGGIAHDFNNMLAGIQGYSELIEAQSREASQVEHYASRILETTQRAADLVSKLLTFSRQGAIEKRYFDALKVVGDTLDLFTQTLDPRIRVTRELPEERVAVHGDESQISNALLNLCINARDALGGPGNITVRMSTLKLDEAQALALEPDLAAGDYILLDVEDDGCGIEPRVLEEIFVPFFTTKPKGQGTGLGLPSVYGALKAHGGSVRVRSELGSGSTFSLYLPAWPPELVLEPVHEGAAQRLDLTGHRVLVVDDEPGVRDTLTRSLGALGCDVTVAEDGRAGLLQFEVDPAKWNLVILDATMPELSGEEVFRAMRAHRSDVRVIVMSGFDRTAVLQRVLLEGAAGVLKKPFSRDELLREIDRVHRSAEEAASRRLRVVSSS